MKRYVAERTSKAEIRPEEQRKKAGSFRDNLWDAVERAFKTEIDTRTD